MVSLVGASSHVPFRQIGFKAIPPKLLLSLWRGQQKTSNEKELILKENPIFSNVMRRRNVICSKTNTLVTNIGCNADNLDCSYDEFYDARQFDTVAQCYGLPIGKQVYKTLRLCYPTSRERDALLLSYH